MPKLANVSGPLAEARLRKSRQERLERVAQEQARKSHLERLAALLAVRPPAESSKEEKARPEASRPKPSPVSAPPKPRYIHPLATARRSVSIFVPNDPPPPVRRSLASYLERPTYVGYGTRVRASYRP